MMKKYIFLLFLGLAVMIASAAQAAVATFDDISLPPGSYYNGSDGAGGFISGDALFNNNYDSTFGSWDGWAVSNTTDTTTPGFGNQYSAITGGGYDGSSNYGVSFMGFMENPSATFDTEKTVLGAYFTNTTWAYLSMRDGDAFAKKFGGADGTDADWFLLTITGKDAGGGDTGTVDFYLADYRFSDNSLDYIVDAWTWVDLSPLGDSVKSLEFLLSSSDVGTWGMNTPGYFAMDNLNAVPIPGAVWLLGSGLLGLIGIRRKVS